MLSQSNVTIVSSLLLGTGLLYWQIIKQKEIMKTRFAATEEDVEKEKRERFEEMKKRQEMKGKQKVPVATITNPPAKIIFLIISTDSQYQYLRS